MQSLLPYLTNNLRVLRLSNAHTFIQISEILYNFDWSQINQLESLTFDLIKSDELSKYFLNIHSILKHLWRLSLTFDEDDKLVEKLLIDHILIPTNQSQSLTNCFIIGINFDLSKLIGEKFNENLLELTLTLTTINDLIILFRIVPNLEILTCTVLDSISNESIDKIPILYFLRILTLTIKKPIVFKNLQKLLKPHIQLKQLSLKAIICDEV
jgi:Trp operon repressor